MDRYLSPVIYRASVSSTSGTTARSHFLQTAREAGAFRQAATTLRGLRDKYSEVAIERGSGRIAKLILKHKGKSLLELKPDGTIAFRPYKFPEALGSDLAMAYQGDLNELFGGQVQGNHPSFTLDQRSADSLLPRLLTLLEGYLVRASAQP